MYIPMNGPAECENVREYPQKNLETCRSVRMVVLQLGWTRHWKVTTATLIRLCHTRDSEWCRLASPAYRKPMAGIITHTKTDAADHEAVH
jgi:hypothetical protein